MTDLMRLLRPVVLLLAMAVSIGGTRTQAVAEQQPPGWAVYASGDEVLALAVNPHDPAQLWAGTEGGGVVVWNLTSGGFRQYLAPTQPGLASNVVYDVAFDARGGAWLATADGVTHATGDVWMHYGTLEGLPSQVVRAIAVGKDGTVWAGLWDEGLVRLAPSGRQWTVVEPDNFAPGSTRPRTGPGAGRVVDIAVDSSGKVWLAHGRGAGGSQPALSLFDPARGTWQHIASVGPGGDVTTGPSTDQIMALDVDESDGRLWLATWARGVLSFDGRQWRQFTPAEGLCGRKVWAIQADGGQVWAACGEDTGGVGVGRWDGHQWRNWTPATGLPTDVVTAIAIAGGRAYLGTNGPDDRSSGIMPADEAPHPVLTTSPATPSVNEVTALLFDPEGTLWVGTRGAGLLRFDGRQWSGQTSASTAGGLAGDTVSDLMVRDGQLWVATMKTLFRDGVYIDGGVSILDLATGQWQAPLRSGGSGLPDDDVSSLASGPDGRVWIGLGAAAGGLGVASAKHKGNGIAVLNPITSAWQIFNGQHNGDGLAGDTVLDLAAGGDAVWVAASYQRNAVDGRNHGGGVSRLASGQWTRWTAGDDGFQSYHGSEVPTDPDPYITGDVRSIAIDRAGDAWAGTWSLDQGTLVTAWPYVDGVVNHFDGTRWRATVFPGRGWVSAMAEDGFGQMWVGMTRGHAGHEFSPAGSTLRDVGAGGMAVWTGATWEEPGGIAANAVTALAVNPKTGLMWVGTESDGLWARQLPPTERGPNRVYLSLTYR